MNVTAFLVGLAAALGYYLYTVYQERSNPKIKSMAGRQDVANSLPLHQERGDQG